MSVHILQVGLGSYGAFLLDRLMAPPPGTDVKVVGIVDPAPCDQDGILTRARAAGTPVYPTIEAFLDGGQADLAVVASPIHLHCSQVEACTARGMNVMCEKPLASTIQEGLRMSDAQRRSGRFVDIGYQWSHATAIQNLKGDILAGAFGKPLRLRTICLWPRMATYYTRNDWSGRLRDASGRWVLDSPVTNATAHFLHNCFYVLGGTRESSLRPDSLQAEIYRANSISSYDTGALRCRTTDGIEILFYASHATDRAIGPIFHYAFEKADVHFRPDQCPVAIEAVFHDGRRVSYGNPDIDDARKLWESVRCTIDGGLPPCPVNAALPHLVCANAAYDSFGAIVEFPRESVHTRAWADQRSKGTVTYAEGLCEAFLQCYEAGCLPSELGSLAWARAGREMPLAGYAWYPGGSPPDRS